MDQPRSRIHSEPGRRYVSGRVHSQVESPGHSRRLDGVTKVEPPKPKEPRVVSGARPALPRLHRSLVLKRHMVERANVYRREARVHRKRHILSLLVALVVIAGLGVVSWVFWDSLPVIKSVSIPFLTGGQSQQTPTLLQSQSNLMEAKPSQDDIDAYQVAPDAPRVIKIPKLSIEARVKRVGTSLSGEPISPSNIFDTGWYDQSSKPGEPGAVLINGHKVGPTKNGVFHDLSQLQPNDQILVEKGDGSIVTYIVNKVQPYSSSDQLDMNVATQSIVQSKNGLNLLTSTENYDGGPSQSGQRVIVFAVQK